jgi:hypothetical protein
MGTVQKALQWRIPGRYAMFIYFACMFVPIAVIGGVDDALPQLGILAGVLVAARAYRRRELADEPGGGRTSDALDVMRGTIGFLPMAVMSLAFGVALGVQARSHDSGGLSSFGLRVAAAVTIAVVLAIGAVAIARSVVRREGVELDITLRSAALTFVVTVFAGLIYSSGQLLFGWPSPPLGAVVVPMITVWTIATAVIGRRLRG